MQRFIHPDKVAQFGAADQVVEIRHIHAVEQIAPVAGFGHHGHQLGRVHKGRGDGRIVAVGHQQHQPGGTRLQSKNLDMPGRREHRAVKVFRHAAGFIHVKEGIRPVVEQPGFVRAVVLCKIGDRLLARPALPNERLILRDDVAHFLLDGQHLKRA